MYLRPKSCLVEQFLKNNTRQANFWELHEPQNFLLIAHLKGQKVVISPSSSQDWDSYYNEHVFVEENLDQMMGHR